MTLDQEFAKYQGQSVLVPGEPESERGQCVQWADYVLHDVYGLPYHYGNAIDWFNNPGPLLNNFDRLIDETIKKGDFVIFNTKVGSVYGHIDIAMSDGSYSNFTGADSNWGGNLTVHTVQHVNAGYVLGVLRLKGDILTPAQEASIQKSDLFSATRQLTEGTIVMKANLSPTNVWDLASAPNYVAAATHAQGAQFEVVAYVDVEATGNRYYVALDDLANGHIYGVNKNDCTIVSSYQPTAPGVADKQIAQIKEIVG